MRRILASYAESKCRLELVLYNQENPPDNKRYINFKYLT